MSLADAARYVVRVRTDLIVLVARSIGDFFFQGISTFAVVFATGWYGISQSGADLAILVVGVGAIVGTLLVSRMGDALLRRGSLNSRLWIGGIGYLLATVAAYPAFLTHSLPVALAFFALAAFFLAGAGPPLDAVRIDVLVPELRGRAEAIRQVARTIAEGGAAAHRRARGQPGERQRQGVAAGVPRHPARAGAEWSHHAARPAHLPAGYRRRGGLGQNRVAAARSGRGVVFHPCDGALANRISASSQPARAMALKSTR